MVTLNKRVVGFSTELRGNERVEEKKGIESSQRI